MYAATSSEVMCCEFLGSVVRDPIKHKYLNFAPRSVGIPLSVYYYVSRRSHRQLLVGLARRPLGQ
jgi:hypothetical protein